MKMKTNLDQAKIEISQNRRKNSFILFKTLKVENKPSKEKSLLR